MIVIEIPEEKFQFLMKTIDSSRSFINKLGVNPLIKQSLTKDIQIVRSIITTNRKGHNEKRP